MQLVAIACYAMGPSVLSLHRLSKPQEGSLILRKTSPELQPEGKTHRSGAPTFHSSDLIDRMIVIEDGTVSHVYDTASVNPRRRHTRLWA